MKSFSFLASSILFLSSIASPLRESSSQIYGRQDDSSSPVRYEVEVTEGTANPDGVKERFVYLLNGKFPAEELVLDEGDNVEIVVKNSISESMTIHFHGIEQLGTPWSDGVPGVSQKAIQPGETFTYAWSADQHGYYHAHAHKKQLQDDGLFFPITIRPASGRETPFKQFAGSDEDAMKTAEKNSHAITIMDWRHRTSPEIEEIWRLSGIEPLCVDSILINGRGSSVCPPQAELDQYAVLRAFGNVTAKGCLTLDNPIINPPPDAPKSDPSQVPPEMISECNPSGLNNTLTSVILNEEEINNGWASISVVNSGGLWDLEFSIDEHPLYVYAIEGQYVNVSQPVDILPVQSGTRYQVFIKLDKDVGQAFTIRAAANVVPQILTGYAVLQYGSDAPQLVAPGPGYPAIPTSKPSLAYFGQPASQNNTALEPLLAPPFPATPPPPESDQTFFLTMTRPDAFIWALNDTGLQPNLYEDSDPLIWSTVWPNVVEAQQNGTGPLANSALIQADSIFSYDNGTVVDLVLRVGPTQPAHPIHKHFNKFWVLGEGTGAFVWPSVAKAAESAPGSFNLVNPPLRDGFNTPPSEVGSWMAIRYIVTNPGPDVLHCHLSQHITGGMTQVFLGGMELLDVPAEYGPPSSS